MYSKEEIDSMFKKAVPIWIEGRTQEMNLRVQFKCVLDATAGQQMTVKIAVPNVYQLFVNGRFLSYGPARAGKGHFRIDEIDISSALNTGKNYVVVETCGYYATSFYLQKQASFLVTEICCNDTPVAWSGRDFAARVHPYYIQKSQRYSFQRPMVEQYEGLQVDGFLENAVQGDEKLAVVPGGVYLKRGTLYPEFEELPASQLWRGSVTWQIPQQYKRDRSLTEICDTLSGFPMETLSSIPTDFCQCMSFSKDESTGDRFEENTYAVYALPYNATGMVKLCVECTEDTELYVLFDEILTDESVDFLRLDCANVVQYGLKPGKHLLQFFEVYTMKYLQIVAVKGACVIKNVGMVEYKRPQIAYDIERLPENVRNIGRAAIETFRQNSVDLFTDCPSRERAGWLCDSFFSGRVEHCLTGKNQIEKCFLENFLHESSYQGLPEGMVPMCYPADHWDGVHIPNWGMFLVLELYEYLERTGDRILVDRFRTKVEKLLSYLAQFENEWGLLESLPGWVFVEWSKANQLVQDVNYPTNMVYAAALMAAGRLYDQEVWVDKGRKLQLVIREQSLQDMFFSDNAVRENGKLKVTGECTEVCQYYAFFFGIADPETDAKLWSVLKEKFGPYRDATKVYPEIYPANAFIGNYLRLEVLMRHGEYERVKENIEGYFGYMAERTGTLWEHVGTLASCNHGFASYAIYWIDQLYK